MGEWMDSVRGRIPIVWSKAYLDNAGAGPLTVDVKREVERFLRVWEEHGEPWDEALEDIVRVRRMFAELVGARLEEVAAVPGVTYGLNALLSSLKLPSGSNVVVSGINFPTGVYTFHAMRGRGLVREVRIVEPEGGCVGVERLEKAVDDNTSIIYVDMVSWITGCREDLRELSRVASQHGALLISDIFQAAGVYPVDVKKLGLDAAFTGSYKWLMGLHGGGFAYVRGEILDMLDPMFSGWMAVDDSVIERMDRGEDLFSRPFDLHRFRRARDAKVLEWGTWPAVAFVSLKASLGLIKEYEAPERYASHTEILVETLIDGLEGMGIEVLTPRRSKAAIVVFKHRDPKGLGKALYREGIVVSVRPGRIRVSPHFYNKMEEVERLLEVVKSYKPS